jgi:hypothetical protein
VSGQCTGWVLRYGPKDRAMRAVLLTIADAANRDGEHAHPGVQAIVEGSLYGRTHVFRTLRKLETEGWLEVEEEGGGRGRAAVYRVRMDRAEPSHQETVSQRETVSLGDRSPEEKVPSETETVPSGDAAPLYATVSNNGSTSASDDAAPAIARQVVADHWERCKTEQVPVPTLRAVRGSPFMALVGIVRSLLEAGHRPDAIRDALWSTSTYTTNGITLELNRHKSRGNGRKSNLTILRELAEADAREAG